MTAASGETRAAAGRQSLFPAIRASYGAALVLAPGIVIYLTTGRFAGRRARRLTQLLGARHLIQAGVSAFAPVPGVLALGAGIDSLHAASMLIFAAVGPRTRRASLTDALAELLFAAAGFRRAPAAGLPDDLLTRPGTRTGPASLPHASRLGQRLFSATSLVTPRAVGRPTRQACTASLS